MYDYTDFDEAFVRTRVAQFTDQVERRLDGSLTEDEFRPLRLMNWFSGFPRGRLSESVPIHFPQSQSSHIAVVQDLLGLGAPGHHHKRGLKKSLGIEFQIVAGLDQISACALAVCAEQ